MTHQFHPTYLYRLLNLVPNQCILCSASLNNSYQLISHQTNNEESDTSCKCLMHLSKNTISLHSAGFPLTSDGIFIVDVIMETHI